MTCRARSTEIEATHESTTQDKTAWSAVLIFRVRTLAALVLAAAAAVVPPIDEDLRWQATAGLCVLVLYSAAFWLIVRRRGRVPIVLPALDVAAGGAYMVAFPELWEPTMLVMAANTAIAATLFRWPVIASAAAGSLGVAAYVGFTEYGTDVAASSWLAFAAATALVTVPVAAVSRHGRAVAGENRTLLDTLHAVVWEKRPGSDAYTYMSPGAESILGHDRDHLCRRESWMSLVHPDDVDDLVAARDAVARFGHGIDTSYRIRRGDGAWIWLHEVVSVTGNQGDATLRGVAVDITAQRTAEEAQQLYRELVEHITSAIVVARLDGDGVSLVTTAANPAAARMLGTTTDALLGHSLADRLTPLDPSVIQRIMAVAAGGDGFTVDRVESIGIDRQRVYTLRAFGLPHGAVGVAFEDVTGSAMVAAALRRQALHDGLTGLPNRTLLRDRLQFALTDARRRGERVALVMMDLNHFKEVNDALGHQYGDRLLTAFAHRLQRLLRECDTIARLGGDEFALLITNATNDGAGRVVNKVTEAMQEPFEIDGVSIQATASMGVALFPDHADDADLLTQRADVAMYTAKRGGGGWSVYSTAHDQSSIERLTLLTDLHRELDNREPRELTLHYQPILDLASDRITGAEALLRWPHPEHGYLNPELVVELAELSGLIHNLAQVVARKAMTACAGWRAAGDDIGVAINLSARNLYDRRLLNWLQSLLHETGLPPAVLKCELTESEVMDDPVLAMDVLSQLRDIGIHTAVDDFGTGYSSLAYLRKLPVDEIKIDKSFVMTMMQDRNDMTIVKTVIDLAHNLGKDVLAEGVEDHQTLEQLRAFGCDRIQGFVIGHPLPDEEFRGVVRAINTPAVVETT